MRFFATICGIVAALCCDVLITNAQVGTQPPTKALSPTSSGSQVQVCHFDSNDSTVHLESKQPDQAPVDRGPATEGRDTLPDDQGRCIQPEQNPTDVPVEASRTAITPMLTPITTPDITPTPETPSTRDFPVPTETPTSLPTPTPETVGGQVPETPEPTPSPEPTPIMPPIQLPGGGGVSLSNDSTVEFLLLTAEGGVEEDGC